MTLSLQHINGIAFIGGGNMATSIVGGLINNTFEAHKIFISEPNSELATKLAAQYHINIAASNSAACAACDIIVLAVKPQILKQVCEEIAPQLHDNHLIISIAAGINSASLIKWLGKKAVVRTMPNTPALISEGACGLFACADVSESQRDIADHIMMSVGITAWVNNENLIDSVTAISGSGPAYFFLMIESMIDAGKKLGLDHETASTLALQTAYGAAKLAQQSDVDIKELRRRVTSPKGTTEKAIESFESNNFRHTIEHAMKACAERAKSLAEELGQNDL